MTHSHTADMSGPSIHVDDWIYPPDANEYESAAKDFLFLCRLPAVDQPREYIRSMCLTVEYRGRRYRCTGASRMGDVWLREDFAYVDGYDLRVDVAECFGWTIEQTFTVPSLDFSRLSLLNEKIKSALPHWCDQ